MTHAVPPTGKVSDEDRARAEAVLRQLLDPTQPFPCESEIDPHYGDAARHRTGDDDGWMADMANGIPSGRHTPHHHDREWFPPETDLTPYTCPDTRSAS